MVVASGRPVISDIQEEISGGGGRRADELCLLRSSGLQGLEGVRRASRAKALGLTLLILVERYKDQHEASAKESDYIVQLRILKTRLPK